MENDSLRSSQKVPPAEDLLRKIHELELSHAQLKQEMSVLATSSAAEIVKASRHCKHRSHSSSPQRWRREGGAMVQWRMGSASFKHPSLLQRENHNMNSWSVIGGGVEEGRGQPPPMRLTDKQYLDILQSMGQSVHIMDQNYCLVFWSVAQFISTFNFSTVARYLVILNS